MKESKLNKYPFLILLIIHSALLLYSFYKNRNKKLFILLLTNIGFAYLFEYFILNLFQAYKYKPKIIKTNYLDNILGAMMSQAIFIPFTAIFITSFQLDWKWKLFFASYFVSIERLFVMLKVYKTNWWKTIFTALLIPLYFYISDGWYKLLDSRNKFAQFVSLYLSISVTGINILYGLVLLRHFRFGIGFMHTWKEHFKIAPLYSLLLSLISAILVRRKGWVPKVAIGFIAFLVDITLHRVNLLKTNFKTILENLVIHTGMVLVSLGLKKMIYDDKQTLSLTKSH